MVLIISDALEHSTLLLVYIFFVKQEIKMKSFQKDIDHKQSKLGRMKKEESCLL